jgi:hypothetical protein
MRHLLVGLEDLLTKHHQALEGFLLLLGRKERPDFLRQDGVGLRKAVWTGYLRGLRREIHLLYLLPSGERSVHTLTAIVVQKTGSRE